MNLSTFPTSPSNLPEDNLASMGNTFPPTLSVMTSSSSMNLSTFPTSPSNLPEDNLRERADLAPGHDLLLLVLLVLPALLLDRLPCLTQLQLLVLKLRATCMRRGGRAAQQPQQ